MSGPEATDHAASATLAKATSHTTRLAVPSTYQDKASARQAKAT